MQQKVLITGGSGLLAVNWALSIRDKYAVVLILHNRKIYMSGVEIDTISLESKKDCRYILNKHRPDIVINTVGLASVEECEMQPKIAHNLHVEIPSNIATTCNDLNVKLIHISTDHLFSGKNQMSFEDEIADPVNIYAKTKSQGELKVQNNCKSALIVRTNFFGWGTKYRRSFSDFILDSLKSNNEVELFKDVFYTPILIDELASRTHQLIDMDARGVYNIVGNERLSKYEFGLKLANFYELDTDLIKAINLENKTELKKRPKDMSLSNRKLCEALKCNIPSIDEQLNTLKMQKESKINALDQVSVDIIPYRKH